MNIVIAMTILTQWEIMPGGGVAIDTFCDRFLSRADLKFAKDAMHMTVNRARGNRQYLRDFFVGQFLL